MTTRSLALRSMIVLGPIGLALTVACGGGSSTPTSLTSTPAAVNSNGAVNLTVTDAPSDSWADIGVIVRGVWLVQAGQTEAAALALAPAYDGSAATASTNLVQLDSVASLLQNASVAAGSYDRVIIKVDGAPANLTLVPALDANGNAQAAIPASQIVVNGAKDAKGWVTVPTITLAAPIAVSTTAANAVNIDFDLNDPRFVVTHDENPAAVFYSVNFVARHKPQAALTDLVLHHNDGTVAATAASATPNTFTVATTLGANLTYNVDDTNKTLFYNLDLTPVSANASLTLPADLVASTTTPLYARVSSRLQSDGSLWAVRVWYSATASKLPTWTPEGHVTKVDATNGFIWILNDQGVPTQIAVTATTNFVFKGGTTVLGTGPAFLANITRGFKVHVTDANATLTPATAATIDIQRALYDGDMTAATATSFSLRKTLRGTTDTPTVGYDPTFNWWNFAYPTTASTSIPNFLAQATATAGAVTAPIPALATSTLNWMGGTTIWDAVDLIFDPSPLSAASQTVVTPYSGGLMGITYTATTAAGASLPNTPVTVALETTAGSQPIVTLYTRSGNGVTATSVTSDQWAAALAAGAKVRVFGLPTAGGQLQAYVINIFN